MDFTSSSTADWVNGTITYFRNPYSRLTLYVTVGQYSGCGIAPINPITTPFITFSSGTIYDLTMSSASNVIGQQNVDLTITFSPATILKPKGQIEFEVPYWYDTGTTSNVYYMLAKTSSVSTSTSGLTVYNGAFSQSTGIYSMDFNSTSSIDSSTTVTLTFTNFRNPISSSGVSGFYLKTLDDEGNIIDVTNDQTFSGASTPASISSTDMQFQIDGSYSEDTTVATSSRLVYLSFTVDVPLEQDCYVKVEFPDQVKINIDDSLLAYLGTGFMEATVTIASSTDVIVKSYGNGNYIIFPACLVSANLESTSPSGTIRFANVVSTTSVETIDSFSITIAKDQSLSTTIASGSITPQFTMTPGSPTLTSFSPKTDSYVQSSTDYQIEFALASSLYSTSTIVITAPSGLNMTQTSSCTLTSYSSQINAAASCSYSSDKFTISGAFTNTSEYGFDFLNKSTITLTINGAINPYSSAPAGDWELKTYDLVSGTYDLVDSGSASSFQASVSTFTSAVYSMSVTSPITYATGSVYTFEFTLSKYVFKNSQIAFIPASSAGLDSSTVACQQSVSGVTTTKSCSVSGTSIVMTLSEDYGPGDTITMLVSGFRNPRSFKPADGFVARTQDSSGYAIDEGTSFTATMSIMGSMSSVTASISNKTNGASTTYILVFESNIPFYDNDVISLKFPVETSLQSSAVNLCYNSNTGSSLSCTVSGQRLQVTISVSGSYTNTFELKVTNVINPPSTRPSSTFTSIYSYLVSSGTNYDIQQLLTSLPTVQTTTPANILTYSISQNTTELGQLAVYTIQFTPTNRISSSGSVRLTWPSELDISSSTSVSISTSKTYTGSYSMSTSSRQITWTSIFTSTYSSQISINLSPVQNPMTSQNLNGFEIETFDDSSQQYPIDILKDLVPVLQCDFPCKTCSSSNKTDCQSCFTDGTYPYLQDFSGYGTCLTGCASGYTTNGATDLQCQKCDTSCATCAQTGTSGDKYRCTSCSSSYPFYYSQNQTCLSKCAAGYYEVTSTTCQQCQAPCSQCQGSATNCTQCIPDSSVPYLLGGACVSKCPGGYAAVGYTCVRCQEPCQTCQNSATRCTSCDPAATKKYFYGYQCYATCPNGTTTDTSNDKCMGCQAGCKVCDTFDQTYCKECSSGLYVYKGNCVSSCPLGYRVNFFKTACESLQNFPLVYFPFLILCLILAGVAIGGYFRDHKSIIITNIIVLWGPVEFVAILFQIALTFLFANYQYAILSFISFFTYIVINVAFTFYFVFHIRKRDSEYQHWQHLYPKTAKIILILSGLLSFKVLKLHYSFLYGYDNFKSNFQRPEVFKKAMIGLTVPHIILCNGLIIAYDLSGLIAFTWGTQLYIIMIETLVISIILIVLEIIEMCWLNKYLEDTLMFHQVNQDSMMNVSDMDPSFDKKMRENMLKNIMGKVRNNQDLFLNNNLDDLLNKFGDRKCQSMREFGNEQEEDPRKTKSEPASPKSDFQFDKDAFVDRHPDNVFAESAPPNPLGKEGKSFTDAGQQVNQDDIDKILARKGGDFLNFEETEPGRKRDKKNRKRGRKNQYYTQIDAEDDEEVENNAEEDGPEGDDELDVIREEDEQQQEEAEKKRIAEEEEAQRKREQELKEQEDRIEQERLEKERQEKERKRAEEAQREEQARLQKMEEERLLKEQEEAERKQREEAEAMEAEKQRQAELEAEEQKKKLEQEKAPQETEEPDQPVEQNQEEPIKTEPAADAQSESDKAGVNKDVLIEDSLNDFQKMQNHDSEIQVPPDAQKRTFNENDILGDFDRDEKGNVIVLQDENGNYVDKQGRPVNERGYLIENSTGNVIENENNQKMFDKEEMDERGEIPAPFCVEKYNFNPHNVRGNFDFDKQGRPIIQKNKQRELVDKDGRRVNKSGYLTDIQGNICDIYNRKKFDKRQLVNEGQDLPKLFNYSGRRFDPQDVCGQFEKDPTTGALLLRKNKNGQTIDNVGRLVNDRGYLVDENENIINKEGKKLFDKKHLKEGEFPKIFPFTKFKLKNVLGDFEMDPLGNPILDKGPNGQLLDREGRIVNQRGYLINENGDVIDKNGKVMFDHDILDPEGDIPKVFRTGLLKSDTASSLSRLMSEIEKNQPFDNDSDYQRIQSQMNRPEDQHPPQETVRRRNSDGTSLDSMMGDTPSNYNIANQRFEAQQRLKNNLQSSRRNQNKIEEVDDSEYGEGDDTGMMRKRRLKKKKKMPPGREVTDKDLMLAKAYGGVAKGQPKRQLPRDSSRIMRQEVPQDQQSLQRLTGSISGFGRDPNKHSMSRKDVFRGDPEATKNMSAFLEGTNEPSMMAEPEHHIREQKLKQKKMNELKKKNKMNQQQKKKKAPNQGGDPDFEKMFGKDIDEFLEDSDWDIESFGKMSNFSKGTARSALGDGRIRGLESIYLQRLETSMKKGPKAQQKRRPPKANFRVMQDRFIDDAEFSPEAAARRNNMASGLSLGHNRNNGIQQMDSANTTAMAQNMSDANIFQRQKPQTSTQYNNGGFNL